MLCKQFDLDLAIIETKEEEDQIISKLNESGIIQWIWIGGTDVEDSFNWYWAKTGEPIRKNMNWYRTEPNNRNEHCMLFFKNGASYYVGNHFCHIKGYPLCQAPGFEQ